VLSGPRQVLEQFRHLRLGHGQHKRRRGRIGGSLRMGLGGHHHRHAAEPHRLTPPYVRSSEPSNHSSPRPTPTCPHCQHLSTIACGVATVTATTTGNATLRRPMPHDGQSPRSASDPGGWVAGNRSFSDTGPRGLALPVFPPLLRATDHPPFPTAATAL